MQKIFFSNSFAKRRPRTKRVSCDVFCGRTSHAVRRVDNILQMSFDQSDACPSQMRVYRCGLVRNVESDFRLYIVDRVILDDWHADLE